MATQKKTFECHKHFIRKNGVKARVYYTAFRDNTGRALVALYAKERGEPLQQIFPCQYQDRSQPDIDHFENGLVILDNFHVAYWDAMERAQETGRYHW